MLCVDKVPSAQLLAMIKMTSSGKSRKVAVVVFVGSAQDMTAMLIQLATSMYAKTSSRFYMLGLG